MKSYNKKQQITRGLQRHPIIPAIAVSCAIAICSAWSQASAASVIRFNNIYIDVTPGGSGPPLASYQMRFGVFTNGFTPTTTNLSQWNSNFAGSSGAYTPGVITRMDILADDNSVYALNSTLYMLVYNVAPGADLQTATSAALLTRDSWTVQTLGWQDNWVDYDGELFLEGEVETSYVYSYTGVQIGLSDFSEDNFISVPLSSYSSPVNDLSLTPDGRIQATTSFIPEPSTFTLVCAACSFALTRRKRHHRASN